MKGLGGEPLSITITPKIGYTFFSGRPKELFQDLHFSPPPTRKEKHIVRVLKLPQFLPLASHSRTDRDSDHENEGICLGNST